MSSLISVMGGISTESMMCTVALAVVTSEHTTWAPLTVVPSVPNVSASPSTVVSLAGRCQVGCLEALAGDHVVREDVGQHVLVGEHGLEIRLRDRSEGVVGRGEDRERTFAVQRVGEPGLHHCGDERRQHRVVAGGGGGGVVGHAAEAALAVGGHGRAGRSERLAGHLSGLFRHCRLGGRRFGRGSSGRALLGGGRLVVVATAGRGNEAVTVCKRW